MKNAVFKWSALGLYSIFFFFLPAFFETSRSLQDWTLKFRDVFFKVRHASTDQPEALQEVLIVTIDEESCEKLGLRWPWSRKVLADLVQKLDEQGAKTIALNFSFTGSEDAQDAASRDLAQAMLRHGHVIIGTTFGNAGRMVSPHPVIAEASRGYGYLEKIVDDDLLIRKSYLLRPYDLPAGSGQGADLAAASHESSFPLKTLNAYLNSEDAPRALRLAADGSYTINFLAQESDFKKVTAWKILEGRNDRNDVKGKVVFAGLTSSLFSEKHATPLGSMPGVMIHANEFFSILSGRLIRFAPSKVTWTLSWAVSLVILALFLWRQFWMALSVFALSGFGLLIGSELLFTQDLVLEPFYLLSGPVFSTVLGAAGCAFSLFLEKRNLEKRVIQDKMTGLYTYDYLRLRLEDEWRRCQRLKIPLSVAMADLDHFKKINDTLGHETGNQMILKAAAVIRESARGYDVVSRYGGDEFVVLLWHSNHAQAQAYRVRLQNLYHAMAEKLDEPLLKASSISVGVASYDPAVNPSDPPNSQPLIENADQDLFQDKRNHRGL